VGTERPDHAPSYYLLDTKANTAKTDREHHNTALDRAKTGAKGAVQLSRARRVEIPRLLSGPLDAKDRFPLVCYTHGPAARDVGASTGCAPLASRATPCCSRTFAAPAASARSGRKPVTAVGIGVMQHDLTDGGSAVVAPASPSRSASASSAPARRLRGAPPAPLHRTYRCAAAIAGVATCATSRLQAIRPVGQPTVSLAASDGRYDTESRSSS